MEPPPASNGPEDAQEQSRIRELVLAELQAASTSTDARLPHWATAELEQPNISYDQLFEDKPVKDATGAPIKQAPRGPSDIARARLAEMKAERPLSDLERIRLAQQEHLKRAAEGPQEDELSKEETPEELAERQKQNPRKKARRGRPPTSADEKRRKNTERQRRYRERLKGIKPPRTKKQAATPEERAEKARAKRIEIREAWEQNLHLVSHPVGDTKRGIYRETSPLRARRTGDRPPEGVPERAYPLSLEQHIHVPIKRLTLERFREENPDWSKQEHALREQAERYVNFCKAFRIAMEGEPFTGEFVAGHPCSGLKDLTQATTLEQLKKWMGGDERAYIASVEARYRCSLDVTTYGGHVLHEAKSNQTLVEMGVNDPERSRPGMVDTHLFQYVRQDRGGLWRMETNLATDASETKEEAASQHYAHCTMRDIVQVLRNPDVFELLAVERRLGDLPVLVGLDAIGCEYAGRRMLYSGSEFNKRDLQYSWRYWRAAPVWSAFVTALVARLSSIKLPRLEDLGEAGAWFLGKHHPHDSPAEREVRIHAGQLVVHKVVLHALTRNQFRMRAKETFMAEESTAAAMFELTDLLITQWLEIRFFHLNMIHTLAASWLSYIFALTSYPLNYTPLDYSHQNLGITDATARYAGLIATPEAREKFQKEYVLSGADLIANMRRIQQQQQQQQTSQEQGTAVIPRGPLKVVETRDTLLACKLFNQSVWSNDRTEEPEELSLEEVTLATYVRAYERSLKARTMYRGLVRVSAMPMATVALRSTDNTEWKLFAYHKIQPMVAPVWTFLRFVHKFVQQGCIRGALLPKRDVHDSFVPCNWAAEENDRLPITRCRKGPENSVPVEAMWAKLDERFMVADPRTPGAITLKEALRLIGFAETRYCADASRCVKRLEKFAKRHGIPRGEKRFVSRNGSS